MATGRPLDNDLTHEGTVLGTPAYMPPEQAAGRISDIDQRSDIYAVGAILYEVLALQPPVDKSGSYLEVLMRVIEGRLVPPQQRDPLRARAGKVPKELSAIAMKALAKDKEARYPSMDALRRDIERFQEGRSVSAKDDTKWEMLVKFVKRNQGFSAATFVALVLISVTLYFVVRNYLAFAGEQREKEARTRQAVPAFLRATRLAVNEGQWDDALAQVNVALDYEPNNLEARLLKGHLLIVHQRFAEARAELENYLQARPDDRAAGKFAELCARAHPDDPGSCLAFAELFTQQKAFALADGVMRRFGSNSVEARTRLLMLYRKRIDAAWPGLGGFLRLSADGRYALELVRQQQVADLAPLKGIPLSALNLSGCGLIRDLTPLEGMPLNALQLAQCHQIRDLAPLRGMPLRMLDLTGCSLIADLRPLQGMKLVRLDLGGCTRVTDLTPLQGMNLTALNVQGCGGIKSLTPLQAMPLVALSMINCYQVRDLTPLEGMSLQEIAFTPRFVGKTIDVLRRMKTLKTLSISNNDKDRFGAEEFWKRYDAGEFAK